MNLEDAAVLGDAAEASTYASTPNTRALAEHYINTPEGNRLHYYESGAGRDVILIHGALVTADDPIIALHDLGAAPPYRGTIPMVLRSRSPTR
jgi:hypothetical protein